MSRVVLGGKYFILMKLNSPTKSSSKPGVCAGTQAFGFQVQRQNLLKNFVRISSCSSFGAFGF